MIYQHRQVIVRKGRLVKRHQAFQEQVMAGFDTPGSPLIGAWEEWVGPETQSAVWQIRQYDSLAAWEADQERVQRDQNLGDRLGAHVYPYNDFVDTALLVPAQGSPQLPTTWPPIDDVQGRPRGYVEQRILYLRPDTSGPHHDFYFDKLVPALQREGVELMALFDTLIGPGTTHAGSHRSVELRRFPDLATWQRWREVQESDETLYHLVNVEWLSRVERLESVLLRPLDYSRLR